MSKISIPEKRGVSGQEPDKINDLTRQKWWKTADGLVNLISIDPLEFLTCTLPWKLIWKPEKLLTCNAMFVAWMVTIVEPGVEMVMENFALVAVTHGNCWCPAQAVLPSWSKGFFSWEKTGLFLKIYFSSCYQSCLFIVALSPTANHTI